MIAIDRRGRRRRRRRHGVPRRRPARAGRGPGPARPSRPPPRPPAAEDAARAGRAADRARSDRRRPAGTSRRPRPTIGVLRDFAAALGRDAARRRGGGPASCSASPSTGCDPTFLGTSAGLRLRHDQPTGRLELNAKSADMAAVGLGRRGDPRLHRRGRRGAGRRAGAAAGLGRGVRRAARRAVRDAAAADRRGRPAGLPVLVGRARRTPARAGRSSAKPGGGTRIGERLSALPRDAVQRPAGPGPGVRAVRGRARVRAGLLGLRQRAARGRRPSGSATARWPR